ncbi:hypothetical protein FOL47_002545 [Perkinsus chesapeaki]|uniref:Uncharacterized protein n=1 Tax=Perkinsus chesapeaki TaxID=330153 RepID=A0A7J6MEP1_PERCH|nr:hypothetical protein FOL47_002545 [Perkinsus chesapeaki]
MIDRTRSSSSAASTGALRSDQRGTSQSRRVSRAETTEDFLTDLDISCANLHSHPDVIIALLAVLKEDATPAQRKLVLKSNEALNVLLAVGFNMGTMKVLPGSEVRAEVARDMLNVQIEQIAMDKSSSQIEALMDTNDAADTPLYRTDEVRDSTASGNEGQSEVIWPEVNGATEEEGETDWRVTEKKGGAPRRRLLPKTDENLDSAKDTKKLKSDESSGQTGEKSGMNVDLYSAEDTSGAKIEAEGEQRPGGEENLPSVEDSKKVDSTAEPKETIMDSVIENDDEEPDLLTGGEELLTEGSPIAEKDAGPALSLMQVVCPQGYEEGSFLQAQTPDGQTVKTAIPEGVKPGDAFIVRYAPRAPPMPLAIEDNNNNEDDDEALAKALQQSFDEADYGSLVEGSLEESTLPTSSRYLSTADISAMGLYFECQGNGTATCAIHAFNNLAQRKALSLTHLQAAESRVALLQRGGSFLAPSGVPMPPSKSSDSTRTGWFDIEALKLASEKHASHVIIETEPIPEFSRSAGEKFVAAANADHSGNGSWFRGFLVYECIPGRAMHYWSILRLPGGAGWVKMDSLHRDEDRTSQHRCRFIATDEELADLYNSNGDYFKSWLMRWYPVVDENIARQSLSGLLEEAEVSPDDTPDTPTLTGVLSDNHWIPADAAKTLLVDSVAKVAHMAQALCLVISSSVAVKILRATEWDWDRAVAEVNDVLSQRHPAESLSSSEMKRLAQSCLATSKWDVETASIVMHIVNSYGTKDSCAPNDLKLISGCVNACQKDLEKAQLAYKLLRVCYEFRESCDDPPTEAASVLSAVHWDLDKACVVIQVHENLNKEPPYAVCAEASRREDFDASPATELLKEFRKRVTTVASQTAAETLKQAKGGFMDQLLGAGPPGEVRDLTDDECAAIADWALRQGQWQPHDCFQLAERMANRFVKARCELSDIMQPDADVIIMALDMHDLQVADACTELRNQRRKFERPASFNKAPSPAARSVSPQTPEPGKSNEDAKASSPNDFNSAEERGDPFWLLIFYNGNFALAEGVSNLKSFECIQVTFEHIRSSQVGQLKVEEAASDSRRSCATWLMDSLLPLIAKDRISSLLWMLVAHRMRRLAAEGGDQPEAPWATCQHPTFYTILGVAKDHFILAYNVRGAPQQLRAAIYGDESPSRTLSSKVNALATSTPVIADLHQSVVAHSIL